MCGVSACDPAIVTLNGCCICPVVMSQKIASLTEEGFQAAVRVVERMRQFHDLMKVLRWCCLRVRGRDVN